MSSIRYFISFYKPYKKIFFLDLLCASVISVIDISFPLILNLFVTAFLVQPAAQVYSGLPWVAAGLLVMYLIKMYCRYYVSCQGHIMGTEMETDMRRDLFKKLTQLSYSYFDENNTGTLTSRMTSDLMDISEFAHHGPENLFICTIKIIGSFAIMMVLSWPLALALLLVTVVMIACLFTQNRKMENAFMDNRRKIAEVNASAIDSIEGIRIVQAFGNESYERNKFKKANQKFRNSKSNTYKVMGSYYALSQFFQGLLYCVVLVVGGLLCAAGRMHPVELSTFALYVNVFVNPLEILIEFTEMFQRGISGFRRFEEIMKEQPAIQDPEHPKTLNQVKGEIELDHVNFAYEDGSPVLKDVSLKVTPGMHAALAGPSGSGKTTICSLIPRFYDVTSGSVKIDGQDVRDLSLESLRSAIGVVSQDVYLFDGTIGDNIRYGNWQATDEEVLEAARKASLSDLIDSLPEGLNTRVGEKGTRLSGGQKQRISIARIFLKDPAIVILDEATSALDNESEYYVQQSLARLMENRTSLTITHRLSTIENADEIFVISDQKVAEQGTHDELLRQGGIYASYVSRTFDQAQDHKETKE